MHGCVIKAPRITKSHQITMFKLGLVLSFAFLAIGNNVESLDVFVVVDSIAPSDGSDVVFTCDFTLDTGEAVKRIIWYVGENFTNAALIADWLLGDGVENSPGFSGAVYQMNADNVDTNRVTLTIDPVSQRDEGNYWCEVSLGAGDNEQSNSSIVVTVPPTNVQISSGTNEFEDGDKLQILLDTSRVFVCNTQGVKPAATLSWFRGGTKVSPSIDQVNIPNGNLFDSQSTYTLQADMSDHDKELTCTSSSSPPADDVEVSTAVDLYVQVPPTSEKIALSDSNPYNNSESGSVRQDVEHTFQCNVIGTRPEVLISWTKEDQFEDGEQIAQENGKLIDTLGTLKVTPSRDDHGSILKCDADIGIDGVSAVSKQLALEVYGPPDTPLFSGSTELTEHIESNDLTCTASNAYPSGGSITWYNNNNQIQKGGTHSSNGNRFDIVNTLSITPLRKDNQHAIKCEVRHGTLTSPPYLQNDTTINVKFCPNGITVMVCPSVEVGKYGELRCESSSSNPKSTLEWYEGGNKVPDTHQLIHTESDYFGFDATLQYKTREIKREDYNTTSFKCCAINTAAGCAAPMCSDVCQLNILYPPEEVSITKSTDGAVNEGSNITLTCKAGGNPEPFTFRWQRDGSLISGETTRILTYETISRDDAGMYSCTAGNGVSNDKESLSSPVPVYYPATIDMESEIRGVDPGDDITLKCVAHGLPNPEIRWIHPQGYTITNGTDRMTVSTKILQEDNVHRTIIKGLLIIYSVSSSLDYGTYSCKASNSLGESDVFYINIHGTTEPKPVTNLTIEASSISTLTITWIPGYSGGDNLNQWFFVDYRKYTNGELGKWSVEEKVVDGSNRYVVSGLDQDTTYDIRVFSENEVGRNPNGEKIQEKTDSYEDLPVSQVPNVGAAIGGSLGAVIFLMLLIIIVLVVFLRKRNSSFKDLEAKFAATKDDEEPRGIDSTELAETEFNHSTDGMYGNILNVNQFVFPRKNLTVLEELGHGEFGKVLLATTKEITSGNKETKVAIKTLKEPVSDEAKQLLFKEFEVMKLLMIAMKTQRNPNIIRLIGGCLEKDPMYVVLEYMPKGDLKTVLRDSRTNGDDANKTYDNLAVGSKSLTPVQLIKFAHEVANGMDFLAAQKCIHRDLATRNILLNECYECKVSDFGLAQDVMNIEVYQRKNQGRLPIRWMAIESLDNNMHTVESDVWSYGVLLWEIITLGARPYPRMKAAEIRQMLRTGYRMPQPNHCSEQLYNIMLTCWEKEPSKRPSFHQIMRLLDEILEGQMGYLKLSDFESKLYEDTTIAATNEKV